MVAETISVGRAFRAYCLGEIDAPTLERVNQVIDRILERDLSRLSEFMAKPGLLDEATQQAFVNAGLAFIAPQMSSTNIAPNRKLCEIILRHVLSDG